eukprot:CAMPEP_0184691282 /NCGR_PEP_ID=MMETSP0313-20130426/178_1 /TAXON_ID=2792 /ORGANISM="Porphyridium aerugineum, Strain SAG 1380-2" /LENGTH=1295 /DNA_ID=CAMNT_0027148963 /DNA_START=357 /DNA_END=4245 /DNA_ORIENTATION=-
MASLSSYNSPTHASHANASLAFIPNTLNHSLLNNKNSMNPRSNSIQSWAKLHPKKPISFRIQRRATIYGNNAQPTNAAVKANSEWTPTSKPSLGNAYFSWLSSPAAQHIIRHASRNQPDTMGSEPQAVLADTNTPSSTQEKISGDSPGVGSAPTIAPPAIASPPITPSLGAEILSASAPSPAPAASQTASKSKDKETSSLKEASKKSFTPGVSIISSSDVKLRRVFVNSILKNAPADNKIVLITVGDDDPSDTDQEEEGNTEENNDLMEENIQELKNYEREKLSSNHTWDAAFDENIRLVDANPHLAPLASSSNLDPFSRATSRSYSTHVTLSPAGIRRGKKFMRSWDVPATSVSPPDTFTPLILPNLVPDTADVAAPKEGSDAVSAASPKQGKEWMHCQRPEELGPLINKLVQKREFDYVIVEGSGIGSLNPINVARVLDRVNGVKVDTLVTVVNGNTFIEDILGKAKNGNRAATTAATTTTTATASAAAAGGTAGTPEKDALAAASSGSNGDPASQEAFNTVKAMNLVSLVEDANVVVAIADCPLVTVGPSEKTQVEDVISTLNKLATIITAPCEQVPLAALVSTGAYDPVKTALSATWRRALLADKTEDPAFKLSKSTKDATLLYRSSRPFHPKRLFSRINNVATFAGVLRSAGKLWLANRMKCPLDWEQAGEGATIKRGKPFWSSMPPSEWPPYVRDQLSQKQADRFGDRETEIVFVGKDMDKVKIQTLLDSCVLNDEEMVFTSAWESFDDPFIELAPLDEEPDVEQAWSESDSEGSRPIASEEAPASQSQETVAAGKSAAIASVAVADDSSVAIPVEVLKQLDDVEFPRSAMDLLQRDTADRVLDKPQVYSEEAPSVDDNSSVIASWDTEAANSILEQLPRSGLPVTLITGFLGSGKTTLLNYILKADHGLKIAVLVNEFGEIDIDNQIIVSQEQWDSSQAYTLSNGCICCTINESFISAVKAVVNKFPDDVDYLVVETTGVADPAPILNSLETSELEDYCYVDGIFTVVDAENFDEASMLGSAAAYSQIEIADTILLSKTDVASPEKCEEVIAFLKSVRPGVRILRMNRGRVPIPWILDVGMRLKTNDEKPAVQEIESGHVCGPDCDHDHDHDHEHVHEHVHEHEHEHEHEHSKDSHDERDSDHDHEHDHEHDHDHDHDQGDEHDHHVCDENATMIMIMTMGHAKKSKHLEVDGFQSTSFKSMEALDPELFFEEFLAKLPSNVYRAKGILQFVNENRRVIFQLSGRRYHFEEDDWREGETPCSQVVVIGKDINIEGLRKRLEACIAKEE